MGYLSILVTLLHFVEITIDFLVVRTNTSLWLFTINIGLGSLFMSRSDTLMAHRIKGFQRLAQLLGEVRTFLRLWHFVNLLRSVSILSLLWSERSRKVYPVCSPLLCTHYPCALNASLSLQFMFVHSCALTTLVPRTLLCPPRLRTRHVYALAMLARSLPVPATRVC